LGAAFHGLSLLLRWRRRRRNGRARNGRLLPRLLLLELQLPLLHFLQHLLWRLYGGLIGRGRRLLLFRLGGRLVRRVIRIVVGRFRRIPARFWQWCPWIARVLHDPALRLFCDRGIIWACVVLWVFCHQHNSRQH